MHFVTVEVCANRILPSGSAPAAPPPAQAIESNANTIAKPRMPASPLPDARQHHRGPAAARECRIRSHAPFRVSTPIGYAVKM
jgi:hypothetical protein